MVRTNSGDVEYLGEMLSPEELTVFFILYVAVNLVVFAIYARDKHQARRNAWRTSEAMLLILALFGPFGAYTAMHLFHHKTRKPLFWLVPLFFCLQIVLIGFVLSGM
jgi:uncharacterized membrane protein YsdA (DUF1294 family)